MFGKHDLLLWFLVQRCGDEMLSIDCLTSNTCCNFAVSKLKVCKQESVVVSRSREQRNLCHFVTNGDFLGVCAQSRKRCLSASVREPCNQRVSEVGQASRPFSPCAHKVTNGSQHAEHSCQRPNVSFITISHAHTLVAAAKDLPAPPRFATPDTLHWPNISLYHTLCPCLVGGDRGPHVSFLCWRIHGKEKRGCNNAHEDQLRHCEIEPTCFLNKPAGLSVHSSMLFSVCEFHKKKTHFAARPTGILSKLPGPEVVLNNLPT